jgi:hypothetical protein
MPARPWTAAEDELVRTVPPPEAARRTGRTVSAIYHRRLKLGVAAPTPPWTPAEDRLVMRLPPHVAVQYLRRSLRSIHNRRRRLGLSERG